MRIRNLVLTALYASIALGAAAPAFADDDWHRHERHEWREHDGREHGWHEHGWHDHDGREQGWRELDWREHEGREHHWRENYYAPYFAPPVVVAPGYGYYAPPPAYYGYPRYDR